MKWVIIAQSSLLDWTWLGGHTRIRACCLQWRRDSVFLWQDGRASRLHPGSKWWSSQSRPLSSRRYTNWTPSNHNLNMTCHHQQNSILGWVARWRHWGRPLYSEAWDRSNQCNWLGTVSAGLTGHLGRQTSRRPRPHFQLRLALLEHYWHLICKFWFKINKYKDYQSQSLFH